MTTSIKALLTFGIVLLSASSVRSQSVNGVPNQSLTGSLENNTNKGVANGYAPLDSNTRLPAANLPQAALQAWALASAYSAGDMVIYQGRFLAVANNAIASGTTFSWSASGATWSPVLPSGYAWRGAFAGSTTYAAFDVVARFNTLYVSTVAGNTGVDPATASSPSPWTLLLPAYANSATGTGAYVASASAAGASSNCAKWDANGNVVDAGAPCSTATGTVTSVALSMPSTFCSVANSPVTAAGSLACAYATGQTANRIFGSDASGNVGLMPLTTAQLPNGIPSSKLSLTSPVSGVYVSKSTTAAYGGPTTFTPPTNITNGNVLIAAIGVAGATAETWTVPSGFTQIGSTVSSAGASKELMGVFCKVASNESGNYTFGGSSIPATITGVMFNLSGVSCTPDGAPGTAAGSTSLLTINSFPVTNQNDTLVVFSAQNYIGGVTFVSKPYNYSNLSAVGNTTEFLVTFNGASTPAVTLSASNSSLGVTPATEDFVAMAIALQPTASATTQLLSNGSSATFGNISLNGGLSASGPVGAASMVVPNETVGGFYYGINANGTPVPLLGNNVSNNIQLDPYGTATFVSIGQVGRHPANSTLLIMGGAAYWESQDGFQDLTSQQVSLNDDLMFGWFANSFSAGSTDENDMIFGEQAKNAFHWQLNSTTTNSDVMALDLANGLSIADMTNLSAEKLTNGSLTGGASWSVAGDFSLVTNTAKYTHSTGSGTLTQSAGSLANPLVGNRRYQFTYVASALSVGTVHAQKLTCNISTSVATVNTPLALFAGTQSITFTTNGSPGNFVISCTSTGPGTTATITTLSLKQAVGGSALVSGNLNVAGNTVLGLGSKYQTTKGTNATSGVVQLSGGTVTVSTSAIGTLAAPGGGGDVVVLNRQNCSSCGSLSVGAVTAGTSFVINSTNASDASNVYWEIRRIN